VTTLGLIKRGESLFNENALYYGHGTSCAFDEAAYIVLTLTGQISNTDVSVYELVVSDVDEQRIIACFQRRVEERIPAAYLLNEAWFAGLSFYVNEHVLVPRSPFAELIADGFAPWVNADTTKQILDLCTGSGCIGIACAMTFPDALVDLADISLPALDVAKQNITRHTLNDRVAAIESDLFNGLRGRTYDLIVSNPPYVGEQELNSLPDEFYKEPQLGLAGGETGLDLVHHILATAADYLNDNGVLYVEVGNTDEALQACYPTVPFLWQEFDYGGHGIFMLTKQQLLEYNSLFQAKLA